MDDGGPAFPTSRTEELHGSNGRVQATVEFSGMTLRDWFAGQALGGLLADHVKGSLENFSRLAYAQADAMLAERAKVKP